MGREKPQFPIFVNKNILSFGIETPVRLETASEIGFSAHATSGLEKGFDETSPPKNEH
jgi:hypothetical protein